MIAEMSETQHTLHEKNSARPFGRFLLENVNLVTHNPEIEPLLNQSSFQYADEFATQYKDLLNPIWKSKQVVKMSHENKRQTLEFAQNEAAEGWYTWKLYSDGQQCDMLMNSDGYRFAVHYEMSQQNAVLSRHETTDETILDGLQQIIVSMTTSNEFLENCTVTRAELGESRNEYQALIANEKNETLSFKERKDLDSIRSHLFKAGFPVGSRDIRAVQPLLSPRDRRPVVIENDN